MGICVALALACGACAAKQVADAAPGASMESYGGFQPSDSPPKCVPTGTVCYEIYDSAANMRYWVFRWPEGGGYSVVPRLTVDGMGRLVPYAPPTSNATETTTGTVGVDE